MVINRGLLIGLAAVLALVSYDRGRAADVNQRLNTPLQAVQQAELYTGFAAMKGIDISKLADSCQKVTYFDSTTPFIAAELDGRSAWVVPYRNVVLNRPLAQTDSARYAHDCAAFLDAETGLLLKIVRTDTTADSLVALEPPSNIAVSQLKRHAEQYFGLPDEPPRIPLYNILNRDFIISGPLEATRLTAQYVLYSHGLHDTIPAWVIYLRGIPAMPWFGLREGDRQPPAHQLSVHRVVFDERTGDMLVANNFPVMPANWRPGK